MNAKQKELIENIIKELQDILSEEEDKLSNMEEKFGNTDKYASMEEAKDLVQQDIDALEGIEL